ncbi:PAS domain S-box protein [Catalinimonas sp. 4WD22]|uniref:PAS domain S-box protein n=1 Tax=Catalinimonas locisalis TaxID=3133978 RepID=UPI0031016FE3
MSRKNVIIILTEVVTLSLLLVLWEVEVPFKRLGLVVIFVLQAIIICLSFRNISSQFKEVEVSLEKLSSGKLDKAVSASGDLAKKGINYINQLFTQMQEATRYIEKIGSLQQNTQEETDLLHFRKGDQLGKALVDMRDKMQAYQDEEKRRNWSTEGHAYFAEILRENTDNLEEFSNQVIRHLVKYLKCNQGSLFIEQENQEGEPYLELTACYAYDKQKYQEKKVKLGQGLVGQCAFEKQTMCITDLPQNYVHITSGLGEATPAHLVIVPLKVNQEFHGVIELASFQKLAAHEIAFLEKVAESIASTLGTVKVTMQTQHLLDNSRELTAELRAREEEMRHHLDTLTTAQKEMQIKQSELQWVFQAMDNSLLTATLDLDGHLLTANNKLVNLSGFSLEVLQRKDRRLFIPEKEESSFWQDIQHGIARSGDFKLTNHQGEEKWINASFTPTQADKGQQKKVLMLGTDITEKKLVLEKLSLVANNTDNSVIITDGQGCIEFVNEGFTRLTGYSQEEVIGKKPGHVLQGPLTNTDTVNRIRGQLRKGVSFYEEILNYKKNGQSYWISLMINPVRNEAGKIEKYVSIQTDVTEIKETTLDYTGKLEAIGRSNAFVEFDPEGKVVEANSIYLNVTGYNNEELQGKTYEYLLPESEKGKPQVQMMWDNLKAGTFFSGEFIQKSKDGRNLWLNGTFNPIFDLENKLQKILMFAQFNTHEKEKYNELSAMLEALNSSVMTLEMDPSGALKKGNALFLQTFGYKRSEISRKNISEITKNSEGLHDLLFQLGQENRLNTLLTLITQEGDEKTYQATFNAMRNLDQQVNRIVVILIEH